jgi:DNA-binding protein YbaB
MFGDMMGKLREAQEKMEESKKRLDSIQVEGKAEGVIVLATAGKEIKSVDLSEDLLAKGKEETEKALMMALNDAMQQAAKVADAEMQDTAKGLLPNIPGLF